MSAAQAAPPSTTCRWDFNPRMPGSDLCAACTVREDTATAPSPHEGLDGRGPGFYERESVSSPFASDPPPTRVPVLAHSINPGEASSAYGRAVLAAIGADLACWLADGEGRNSALWKMASRLARLADGGHVDRAEARERAVRIAEELCPDERAKSRDTIRRAFRRAGGER